MTPQIIYNTGDTYEIKIEVYPDRDQWLEAKKGVPSASDIFDCMTKPDADELPDGAITYALEKLNELTGNPTSAPPSYAMQWGIDHEREGVDQYLAMTGRNLNDPELMYTTDSGIILFQLFINGILVCCATPDLIEPDCTTEFKCPEGHNHLRIVHGYIKDEAGLRANPSTKKWADQAQMGMMLAKKQRCKIVSYDPRQNNQKHQMTIIKLQADPVRQAQILKRCIQVRNVILGHAQKDNASDQAE